MLHVLNTRPTERADGLNQALQQAGYRVSALPLLELVAEPLDTIQQPLAEIRQVAVVVVVSPAAAQLGLDALKQLNIVPSQLTCQWVAVGQGTATVLAQAGIRPHVPALETSEGMLALELFDSLQGQQPLLANTVMFWRGHGGRQFMLKHLANQHPIISINLYYRQLPDSSRQLYSQLLSQQVLSHAPQVLLITSGVSWQNWQELGQQFGVINPAYILVLGQRVYQDISQQVSQQASQAISHELQCIATDPAMQPRVMLLENLNPNTILQVLNQLQKCQQT
jgi:uroporphyrinogen-III synthase